MILAPVIGAILQVFLTESRQAKVGALLTSLLGSLSGVIVVASMRGGTSELQLRESFSWIGAFSIAYDVGIDGLNILPTLLVALVFPILIAAEWNCKRGQRGMHALLLVLQGSFAGAVSSQDLFLMFFFWALRDRKSVV